MEHLGEKELSALLDGAPEYNLDMLQRYMKHCDVEIKKLTPAAPAPGPANINGLPTMPGAAPPMPGPAEPMPAPMPAPPMAA